MGEKKNDEYRIEKQETRLESQRISTASHFNKFMDNMGEIKNAKMKMKIKLTALRIETNSLHGKQRQQILGEYL